jgi:hypothetical protein
MASGVLKEIKIMKNSGELSTIDKDLQDKRNNEPDKPAPPAKRPKLAVFHHPELIDREGINSERRQREDLYRRGIRKHQICFQSFYQLII